MATSGLLSKIQRQPAGRRAPRRWVWGVLIVGALGAALLLGRGRVAEVQVASVLQMTPSAQYQQLTASGFVVAQRRAAVASKASGRLIELNVREGSRVKAGELLARLDASDVRAALQVAQAAIGQAQALALQGLAQQRQAEVERANAEAEFERARQLRAENFISPQALDAARRRLEAARAGVAAAQAAAGQGQASVAQARAQLGVQQVNQGYTEIRAPFDGVVLAKNANVGDLITPFSNAAGSQGAVLTLADLSTLEVEADVSEGSLGLVKREQPVEIVLDALPGQRFRGQLVSIVPTVDRAKATVMTKLRFEKLDERVLPEMSAKVFFLSRRPSDAEQQPVLAVNPKALDGGRLWRIVKQGEVETVQALAVKSGRKLGEWLEVSAEGLKSGDRLVLEPKDLREGQKVKVASK